MAKLSFFEKDGVCMQTTIYYFSATGNSLYAAKTIAENIGDCHLVSISAMMSEERIIPETANVGLVFPMHYFGVPPMVKQFIERLDLSKIQYVFAVATCGNAVFGSVMHQLRKLLAAKASTLNAGFYVPMVDSYIPIFTPPKEKTQQQILNKAEKKIARICDQVKDKQQSIDTEYFCFVCPPIHNYWLRRFPKIDTKFTNSAQCTSCGLCAKVCPVDNIVMVDGRPHWQHHCQECLACLHFCPAHSIEFGKTQGKARYHHPQISIQEIIQGKLK